MQKIIRSKMEENVSPLTNLQLDQAINQLNNNLEIESQKQSNY